MKLVESNVVLINELDLGFNLVRKIFLKSQLLIGDVRTPPVTVDSFSKESLP